VGLGRGVSVGGSGGSVGGGPGVSVATAVAVGKRVAIGVAVVARSACCGGALAALPSGSKPISISTMTTPNHWDFHFMNYSL
jgi:hypothetical protein